MTVDDADEVAPREALEDAQERTEDVFREARTTNPWVDDAPPEEVALRARTPGPGPFVHEARDHDAVERTEPEDRPRKARGTEPPR